MIDKDEFALKIGVQIKKIRTNKGITLSELGLLGDFDKHALSKIENGKKQITVYSLHKICVSLGITIEDFFKGLVKNKFFMVINNFRFINKYKVKPNYLDDYDIIHGYRIYHSNFNILIYVILNHMDNTYHSFENNGESQNINFDLDIVIRTYFNV